MIGQRGITKFEFACIVALIGVLAFLLLERLAQLERDVERVAVDVTIRNMRVGLQLAIGERLMRGEDGRMAELLDRNPVSFLGRAPEGYGEWTAEGARPGSWRYDPAARLLEYRPRQPEAFAGRTVLRWRLAAISVRDGRVTGLSLAEEAPDVP